MATTFTSTPAPSCLDLGVCSDGTAREFCAPNGLAHAVNVDSEVRRNLLLEVVVMRRAESNAQSFPQHFFVGLRERLCAPDQCSAESRAIRARTSRTMGWSSGSAVFQRSTKRP